LEALPSSSNLIRVKIDGEEKELFFLTCGARNCAASDLETGYSFNASSAFN